MKGNFEGYSKYDLQELWLLSFIDMDNKPTASEGENDAVFCMEIDAVYKEIFGLAEFDSWKEKR